MLLPLLLACCSFSFCVFHIYISTCSLDHLFSRVLHLFCFVCRYEHAAVCFFLERLWSLRCLATVAFLDMVKRVVLSNWECSELGVLIVEGDGWSP